MQLPASAIAAGGGAKAAGLRSAKAHAAGAAATDAGGSGRGGTGTTAEAEAERLAGAGGGAGDPSAAAGGVPRALGDWDGGQTQGQQSWDESAPSGRLIGACQTLTRLTADPSVIALPRTSQQRLSNRLSLTCGGMTICCCCVWQARSSQPRRSS